MKSETIMFEGTDGYKLPACIWTPDRELKSIVQLAHGMTEHMGRYESLAESLCKEGIALAGFDLRGHGRNPGDSKCAAFGEGGWDKSLEDMHLFFGYLNGRFADIPHAMLGFSLGSFLLRDYLNSYDDNLSKAIIMGTGRQPGLVLGLLKKLVRGQCEKFGFNNSSELVKKLSFESYNAKFKPNRTSSDWLCGDEKELDSYISDPLCREEISTGLFWQMLDSMQRTGSKTAYAKWNKELPVLLISGENDPVGDMGKGVRKLAADMQKAGVKSVEMELLKDARHDVLHEVRSGAADEATRRIIEFISK